MKAEATLRPKGILTRKIRLKNQAIRLIRSEREELRHQLMLLEFKEYLEKKTGRDFNLYLSQQLECVQALLDSMDISGNGPGSL